MGEAPGVEEDRTGVPFVGGSGVLLTKFLNQASLERGDCYITNVVKYQPPGNNLNRLSEIGLSLGECENELREELRQLNPNVIVPLGNTALKAVTGLEGITLYRGSILRSLPSLGEKKVIPSIHPASILRKYEWSLLALFDFIRIAKESAFPGFDSILSRHYTIDPTFSQSMELIEKWKLSPRLALDIETDMGASYIKCIGFADSPTSAGCIPMVNGLKSRWTLQEETELWKGIKSILADKNKEIIIQNMSFEMECLYKWTGEIANVYMDTMLASHIYLPELPKRLSIQASIYTSMPFYKNDAKEANYESIALWKYNCDDCAVTFEISLFLDKVLEEAGLTDFLHGFQMPLGRVLWRATHIGLKIDTEKVKEYRRETEEKVKKAKEKLLKIVGEEVNVNSSKQMISLLYGKHKLPKQYKLGSTGKRAITTDEKALVKLAKLFPSPMFEAILEVRGQLKFLSTYCKEFWEDRGEGARCYSSYNITGAKTGRLSSSENIRKQGLNLQNIPPFFRDVILSDEGTSFIVVDLSQVESRLVAYMSQDPTMIQVFEDGKDIHAMVGAMICERLYELCGKGTPERDRGKTTGHSANYKISPPQLAATANISIQKAKDLLHNYYTLFNIGKWHGEVIEKLKKDRTLYTPHGRRRIFYERWPTWKEEQEQKGELFKSAYANEPQGTANDHINLCGIRLYHQIDDRVEMLIQCHDEWVFQTPDFLIDSTIKLIRKEMDFPLMIRGRSVRIPVDVGVGKNWLTAGGK